MCISIQQRLGDVGQGQTPVNPILAFRRYLLLCENHATLPGREVDPELFAARPDFLRTLQLSVPGMIVLDSCVSRRIHD